MVIMEGLGRRLVGSSTPAQGIIYFLKRSEVPGIHPTRLSRGRAAGMVDPQVHKLLEKMVDREISSTPTAVSFLSFLSAVGRKQTAGRSPLPGTLLPG